MAETKAPTFSLTQYGILKGHNGWVTKICVSPSDPDTIISASRDKSILIWRLFAQGGEMCGKLVTNLQGHSHFVSDISISKDGGFLISASWDRTLRLWDINKRCIKRTFLGHTDDVTSVSFSSDNRQIVSGSRDKTVRLWNTLAVQKYAFEEDGHKGCVSGVVAIPIASSLSIFSSGHDGVIKLWSLNPTKCQKTFYGHTNSINSMAISPNYVFMASGGKDGLINLWNLSTSSFVKQYNANGPVSAVAFNPRHSLLAVGVGPNIKLFDIKNHVPIDEETCPIDIQETKAARNVVCLAWSNDGTVLFAGYTDSHIRIFLVTSDLTS